MTARKGVKQSEMVKHTTFINEARKYPRQQANLKMVNHMFREDRDHVSFFSPFFFSPAISRTSQSLMVRTAVAQTAGTWWMWMSHRTQMLTRTSALNTSSPGLSMLYLWRPLPCRWRTSTSPGQRAISYTFARVRHVSLLAAPQLNAVPSVTTVQDILTHHLLQCRLCPKTPVRMLTPPRNWW